MTVADVVEHEHGPCCSNDCDEGAEFRVFWPGQTSDMCAACRERAVRSAAAMGFQVTTERLRDD